MANIHRNLGELRPCLKCSVDRLTASDIPVLILIPRDETGNDGPMMVRRYRQQLPHAQVALVNDANHLVFIDGTNLVGHELQKFLVS